MNVELDSDLDKELRDALAENREIEELRAILVKYREKNFRSESVYRLLDESRIGMPEDIEDRILELMDIVSGFCSLDKRVWQQGE